MRKNILRELGDGLLLRRATLDDIEELVAFQANVHRDPGVVEPDESVGAWTRDLMTSIQPTFRNEDFSIVEDSRSGDSVSALCHISLKWSYRGVGFGVGLIDLVGTCPDYRRRGLVRAQFEEVHQWSARRGEMVQAIAGIPWYYRQFGYEMALELGGEQAGFGAQVPTLRDDEDDPIVIRPASEVDLPFIAKTAEQETGRYLVTRLRDGAEWRYELQGKSEKSVSRLELKVIESDSGDRLGFLAYAAHLQHSRVEVEHLELVRGAPWFSVMPSVIRHLWSTGCEWSAKDPGTEMASFAFRLGTEHPAYQAARSRLPAVRPAYAWYLRVGDVPSFAALIAPVLERRLESSAFSGYSGKLKVGCYRWGLLLSFNGGKLAEAAPWNPSELGPAAALFPDLTFLQLLFGYRSLEELEQAYADCGTRSDEARALLRVLFPKRPSHISTVS